MSAGGCRYRTKLNLVETPFTDESERERRAQGTRNPFNTICVFQKDLALEYQGSCL